MHLIRLLKSIRWKFIAFMGNCILPLYPIKKSKIIFDNNLGRGYGDNPKYIADEIIRQGLNYDMVWVVRKNTNSIPPLIRTVKYGSFRFFYELSTAKVWIDNVKNCYKWKKRKDQYYIQTWHGGGIPMKLVENQISDHINKGYVKISKNDSKNIDLILSDSNLLTQLYKEAFWLPASCEVFNHGLPRNDYYFKSQKEIDDLKRVIAKKGEKIALYAPTFRDDNSTMGYRLHVEKLYETLKSRSNDEWVVIIRMHPNASKFANLFSYNDHVLNGSDYPDSQELTLVSDVLITDYSGLMSDFIMLKKPVFLFALDLNDYQANCRPLPPIYTKLPFPLCKTNEKLFEAINEFDKHKYEQQLEQFMTDFYQSYDDGHAAEAVVGRIKEVMNR